MDQINLTPIIQAIIALLAALITCKLIPWIQSKTTEQQQNGFRAVVRVLVYAAEQIYGAGKGREKLEYVCRELRERGFEVDLSEIEAAVYNQFNWGDPILRPAVLVESDETEPPEAAEAAGQAESGRMSGAPPDAAAESRGE